MQHANIVLVLEAIFVASTLTRAQFLLTSSANEAKSRTRSRNHTNFYNFIRPNSILFSASEYLYKFGWIKPKDWVAVSPRSTDDMYQDQANSIDSIEQSQILNNERTSNFGSALMSFQRSNGLNVSGLLDAETMLMMSRIRCGVPDQTRQSSNSTRTVEISLYNQDQSSNNVRNWSDTKTMNASTLRRERRSVEQQDVKPLLADSGTNYKMFHYFVIENQVSNNSRLESTKRQTDTLKKKKFLFKNSSNFINSSEPINNVAYLLERILSNKKEAIEKKRRKRSFSFRQFGGKGVWGMAFAQRTITWRLVREWPYTGNTFMSINDIRFALRLAFRIWSEVMPRNFHEDNTSPASQVDILIGFGSGKHHHCPVRFVSRFLTREYAHAWALPKTEIHFNNEQPFVPVDWYVSTDSHRRVPYGRSYSNPISLLKVAVHEIGHTLGLNHNEYAYSIMNPYYQPFQTKQITELSVFDREYVQRVYGTCDISFDAVFDLVRNESQLDGNNSWKFNTYIFRRNWYWLYENGAQRPRYGDPRLTALYWRGVMQRGFNSNQKIDGIVQIRTNRNLEGDILIFKGDLYIEYDFRKEQVKTVNARNQSYPRRIAEDFVGVPYPIDTVFYNYNESVLYFFKNNMVYRYNWFYGYLFDYGLINVYFPGWGGAPALPNNIDVAYYSHAYQSYYFFKEAYYWKLADHKERNINFNIVIPYNSVGPRQKIASKWKYICDVGASEMT